LRPAASACVFALLAASALAADLPLVDVVAKVEHSVVRIDTDVGGIGSGVIVDDRGFVLTNFHVIDGAKEAKVTLRNGQVLEARGYLAVDPRHDLALLKTDKFSRPSAIRIADKLPRIGEKVAAFGNPRGFSFTTSEGIVSAIRTGDEVIDIIGHDAYTSFGFASDATWIQTTAPISGGNSGGPLVTLDAALVGINTWTHAGQNLNFAISLPDIERLLTTTRKDATPKRFTSLPRMKAKPIAPDRDRADDFKLELPTGRVFSFRVYDIQLDEIGRVLSASNDNAVLIDHPNGTLYAAANQVQGLLDGVTVAQYDNQEPMVYATYAAGKRHGILKTWDEAGKPVLYAQYAQGKRNGFSCYFDDGKPALIMQHDLDALKYVQLMSGLKPLEGFTTRAEAEKNTQARDHLKKIDEFEALLKKNEVTFRKHVREFEVARRQALANRLAPDKRRRIQDRINDKAAGNAAVVRELYRRAYGR
jgi:S1-C subfamily serine protease